MTVRKPRIAVTLSDETRELVQRLADLEETSSSRVVAGIVEAFAPTARQIIEATEAMQRFPEAQRQQIAEAIGSLEPEILAKLGAAQEAFTSALDLPKTQK